MALDEGGSGLFVACETACDQVSLVTLHPGCPAPSSNETNGGATGFREAPETAHPLRRLT
jgi:hypothetical protein